MAKPVDHGQPRAIVWTKPGLEPDQADARVRSLSTGSVRLMTASHERAMTNQAGPPPVAWDAEPERWRPRRTRVIVWLVVAILVVGLSAGAAYLRDRLARPVWSASATELIDGDTWDGNLASDGQRIVLLSREKIQGFWGVMTVRISGDGGVTSGGPVSISARVPDCRAACARPRLRRVALGRLGGARSAGRVAAARRSSIARRGNDLDRAGPPVAPERRAGRDPGPGGLRPGTPRGVHRRRDR